MFKKILIIVGLLVLSTFALYMYFNKWNSYDRENVELLKPITEFGTAFDELVGKKKSQYDSELENKNIINILLLGIDRRSKYELSYRTDIMILLSINPEDNIAVLTSVPRDLWYGGQRVNATYITNGWSAMQDALETFTGLRPDRFILTDFQDFSWIVDAMGGVTVNVERSFVDSSYPIDATKTYQTVSFTQGPEKLTGSRALIYSRSRKGTNGEGSDWARMKRQHLILKGMLDAVVQPGSLFRPMNVEKAFNMVTTNRMDTNLTLPDAYYLWDFYKDKDSYEIESLFLDTNYVYNPPMSEYGGAWVLAPLSGGYSEFQQVVHSTLYGLNTEQTITNNEQKTQTPQVKVQD
jgi:LCP family protein required for cell wall assembly